MSQGVFRSVCQQQTSDRTAREALGQSTGVRTMTVFLLTLGAIAIVMAIMAIGVVLDGRCLRGSCGGPDVVGSDGESLACATCPHRSRTPPGEA